MEILYHGSSKSGLKIIEPHKSTHGTYVYATPYKELAIHFSKRCGDDFTYDIGHFTTNDCWELVEKVPGAFEKMYSNSANIYEVPASQFIDIKTGFAELVSSTSVPVLSEENIPNLYEELLNLEKEGKIKLYRFPNKPACLPPDNSDILDKMRYYRDVIKKPNNKNDFDRLFYLHPYLLDKINALLKEFDMGYQYEKEDIIEIYYNRYQRQVKDPSHEQYLECAYRSIINTFPEFQESIDNVFKPEDSFQKRI